MIAKEPKRRNDVTRENQGIEYCILNICEMNLLLIISIFICDFYPVNKYIKGFTGLILRSIYICQPSGKKNILFQEFNYF